MIRRLGLTIAVLMALAGGAQTWAAIQYPNISRAEAVALLVEAKPSTHQRLQWFIGHMPPLSLFSDSDPKAWYGPYLETAFEAGLIQGNMQRTFRPNALLTTEEAATLITRFKGTTSDEVVLYAPTTHTSWGQQVLADALASGITVPASAQVGQPISRADFYAMLQSAGVAHPDQIIISIDPSQGNLPKPIPVTIHPLTPPVQTVTTVQPQKRIAVVAPAPAPVRAPAPAPVRQVVQTTTPAVSNQAHAQDAPTNAFAISMPTLGIKDLSISHPADPFTHDGLLAPLKTGVGHLFSYPGMGGKILIYGHSSSYPWDVSPYTKIFRQINKLSVGDKVYITYGGKLYTYQVTLKESVAASDMSRYQSEGVEELILYTCWPPDSISQRYLVHAKPV